MIVQRLSRASSTGAVKRLAFKAVTLRITKDSLFIFVIIVSQREDTKECCCRWLCIMDYDGV